MTFDSSSDSRAAFRQQRAEIWQATNEQLFGKNIPEQASWTDLAKITSVLDIVGRPHQSAYMFLPGGGDLDFKGVEQSYEKGCIELKGTQPLIIKPVRLLFSGFSDVSWNFFWLQTGPLRQLDFDPIPSYKHSRDRACLYELEGGKYHPQGYEEYLSDGDQSKLERLRIVKWFHSGGDFLIYNKAAIYSKYEYQDVHFKAGYEAFREVAKNKHDELHGVQ